MTSPIIWSSPFSERVRAHEPPTSSPYAPSLLITSIFTLFLFKCLYAGLILIHHRKRHLNDTHAPWRRYLRVTLDWMQAGTPRRMRSNAHELFERVICDYLYIS